ncbi:alanine/glycine:cation symporter family protein [Saccharococcus caldoxylosilyticus]|uniref:Putative sodium/amino acid symporter n=1 Tax=Parageobacillus caldoxylosilyticus NBRC 107762 TaxID=1220594 RepID=A0A023DBQ9_9BACL|nr:alanine/glycine:cation symporter family protein [Parageobacillus caldoxylosilyticus]OQP03176.1 sodium:alanine symporter [Geobacillus sp. 44B]MBB3851242.1 AGCS family alanine or glycine:cation symporter [Parageobacillus caldoxylosilyticus]QNU38720.1 alanine:cation symporter family protein [Geobacillus sp. 44B]QXJ38481.1 Amino-acid carrier protein AlsT [Parageobacillus caldoxylosilyticus]BDG37823.1 sodium:alanine symporter [Parageobacillus caldoxylosilyticus]
MEKFVEWLNGIIWSPALVVLCIVTGLFYSLLTRFLQVRHMKEMIKQMFQGKSSEAGISSFQALSLALSGRVGTGNIAGVATAIAFGGPGAVFWMWLIAFIGAGSAFVEAALAQVYKTKQDGQFRGGPAYYIEKGLNMKWYAVLFAVVTVLATGVLLPGVQANSIAEGIKNAFGISPTVTGIGIVILLGVIIFGGVKRIARAAEWIVPFMALGYILMALFIVFANISELPHVLGLIFRSAFGMDAAFGGILGAAISWGVKRGIYSNEAGQGTAPHAAAAAEVSHPAKQGLVQAFSVYVDTWFVCSATAFMILITGMYNVTPEGKAPIVQKLGDVEPGPIFTQKAVETVFPGFGAPFVAIALFFFAFTTIMAYYYMAETNIAYMARLLKLNKANWLQYALKVAMLAVVFYGCIKTAKLAWTLGDIGVGSMAWLNLIAILLLTKPALKVLKDYEQQKKAGKDPVFDPVKLGITGADFWEKEYPTSHAKAVNED